LIPDNVLIIRGKNPPHAWSLLVLIGDREVEGDIRPSTQRLLEQLYDVEVASSGQTTETFEILKLSPKNSKP